MNNLNNIPGEIIKTSQLPEDVPSHLIGVILGPSSKTVKYSTQAFASSVSNLITNVVKTDEFYSNPSWLTTLSWNKIISTPSTLGGYGITDPVVLTTASYINPSWITSLDWSKLTNVPSFSTSLASLSDVQLGTLNIGEALVYNGTKWVNQNLGELDTLHSVTTRGNITTNSISVGLLTGTLGISEFKFNTGAGGVTPTIAVGNLDSAGKFAGLLAGTSGAEFNFDKSGWFAIAGDNKSNYTSNNLGSGSETYYLRVQGSTGNVQINSTTDAGYKLDVNGTVRVQNNTTIEGTLTAATVKTQGGTASQFLKADGSVDENNYTTEDLSIVYAIALG